MESTIKLRTLEGVVVSDKMSKTRVVVVESWKKVPKYLKYVRVIRRYKAHDEENQYKSGDRVVMSASRPLSREKRWKIVKKIGEIKSIERFVVRHKITMKKNS